MKENQVTTTTSDKEYIYVTATTMFATRILKTWIQPNRPPIKFTLQEYHENVEEFEHYVADGAISIVKPGDKRFTGLERQFIVAKEMDNKEPQAFVPPKSVQINRNIPEGMREAVVQAKVIKTASEIMNVGNPDTQCIAKTASGERCKGQRVISKTLCAPHIRSYNKGKQIETYLDDIVTDGIIADADYS